MNQQKLELIKAKIEILKLKADYANWEQWVPDDTKIQLEETLAEINEELKSIKEEEDLEKLLEEEPEEAIDIIDEEVIDGYPVEITDSSKDQSECPKCKSDEYKVLYHYGSAPIHECQRCKHTYIARVSL